MSSVFLCIQYLSDVALFVIAFKPNHRERDFTRIPIVLQGALADSDPTASASLSSHSSVSGGHPKSRLIRWMKSSKEEQCCSHALRSMMISFIALFLITLFILGKRAVFLSIALLVGCKRKPSKAEKERVRKNTEIVRIQGKWRTQKSSLLR